MFLSFLPIELTSKPYLHLKQGIYMRVALSLVLEMYQTLVVNEENLNQLSENLNGKFDGQNKYWWYIMNALALIIQ